MKSSSFDRENINDEKWQSEYATNLQLILVNHIQQVAVYMTTTSKTMNRKLKTLNAITEDTIFLRKRNFYGEHAVFSGSQSCYDPQCEPAEEVRPLLNLGAVLLIPYLRSNDLLLFGPSGFF